MKKSKSILFRAVRVIALVYGGLCVLLWFAQGPMIFPASGVMSGDPGKMGWAFEDVRLPVDGHETFGWYVPRENSRGVVLFSHGNAGNLSNRLGTIERLHSFGFSVLAYDYGGYGNSTGSASEKRCYADIRAMWDHLVTTRGIPEKDILLYGRSLGGGATAELAKNVTPGAIILESSFLSTGDVAKGNPLFRPFLWLLRHKFANKDKVAAFTAPLLILHSPEDEVIPYSHGQELFKRANAPKTFVEISGGHNYGFEFSEAVYRAGWEAFLTPIFGKTTEIVDPPIAGWAPAPPIGVAEETITTFTQ